MQMFCLKILLWFLTQSLGFGGLVEMGRSIGIGISVENCGIGIGIFQPIPNLILLLFLINIVVLIGTLPFWVFKILNIVGKNQVSIWMEGSLNSSGLFPFKNFIFFQNNYQDFYFSKFLEYIDSYCSYLSFKNSFVEINWTDLEISQVLFWRHDSMRHCICFYSKMTLKIGHFEPLI